MIGQIINLGLDIFIYVISIISFIGVFIYMYFFLFKDDKAETKDTNKQLSYFFTSFGVACIISWIMANVRLFSGLFLGILFLCLADRLGTSKNIEEDNSDEIYKVEAKEEITEEKVEDKKEE